VVSDVRVSRSPLEQPPKIGAGDCDLYLCCDGIVGADAANLKVAHPERTTSVVSTPRIPTGKMVIDTAVSFPADAEIQDVIDRVAQRGLYLDPGEITEKLFGSSQTSNMLMVGRRTRAARCPSPPSRSSRRSSSTVSPSRPTCRPSVGAARRWPTRTP